MVHLSGQFQRVRALVTVAGIFCTTLVHGAWTLSSPHPAAATHPSSTGRMILDLKQDGARMWTGYGDYGAEWTRIPPVKMYFYAQHNRRWYWMRAVGARNSADPYRGRRSLDGHDPRNYAFESDAVYQMRRINNRLWVPAFDPRGVLTDFAVLDGPWRQSDAIRRSVGSGPKPAHIFDIVEFGGEVYAVGSAYAWGNMPSSCTIWKSSDEGVSWTVFKQFKPLNGYPYSRCYFAQNYKKALWVQPYSYRYNNGHAWSRAEPVSHRFNGSRWIRGQSILPDGGRVGSTIKKTRIGQGARPEVFANPPLNPRDNSEISVHDREVLILSSRSPGLATGNGELIAYNSRARGHSISRQLSANGEIWDFAIHDGYLYVLMANGIIKRTNFVPVSTGVPILWSRRIAWRPHARSISVGAAGNKVRITVGRRDSRLAWEDYDCTTNVHPAPCTPD